MWAPYPHTRTGVAGDNETRRMTHVKALPSLPDYSRSSGFAKVSAANHLLKQKNMFANCLQI